MNLRAFALLLIPAALALSGLSSVQLWLAGFQQPFKNLLDNPLRRSTIPQFILDAQHPWVLANQRKLERLPNAEAFLCFGPAQELNGQTGTETEMHGGELEIPPDVFDILEINNNRAGISRPGWPNALERLDEMKQCQRALDQVKTLDVDIYVHRNKYSDQWLKILEPAQPPEQLLTLFGDVLLSMTHLERLNWGIRQEHTHMFEESFKVRNLTLPAIKYLEPRPFSHYLAGMCPNLERLETGGGFEWYHGYMPDGRDWRLMLVQAAVLTPKLKRFAMVARWTPSLVSEVIASIPQIESLGLLGSLGEEIGYTGLMTEDSGRLKAILDLLTGLENLTHLDLPESSSLAIGFNGGSDCGNVYFGEAGKILLREVTMEYAEAAERGGDIVVANLPHLNSFTIGETQPNITRTKGRMVNATWPWTGRMDEWSMEVVPE